jgi:catechol 2,3-dioxygenase-like lactoylglutathione lyase family enzyme
MIRDVDCIGITVSDMKRSLAFYTNVLSFKLVSQTKSGPVNGEQLTGVPGAHMHVARLQLGDEFIELIQYTTPRGRPIPVDSLSNDHWFQHIAIIVSDMEKAYARLCAHNVDHASPAPQRLPDWNPDAGGVEAFYFRDPDGNPIEILHFPKDKGDPKWQKKTEQLFLGIDHTAIVVNDTTNSLRFYRDMLGLRIAGTSVNYGIEQERLNNVPHAHLRITTLKALHGPGIELLEYLAPRSGRPMPVDTQANDLWYWQIKISTADINNLESTIRDTDADMTFVESVMALQEDHESERHLLIRDPDGHALVVMQQDEVFLKD